jgi:hypothetical protein
VSSLTTTPTPTWPLLTKHQRHFLLKAADIDRTQSANTLGHLIPILHWRTIGVLCALTGPESDQLVQHLAQLGWLEIRDPQARTMILISRTNLRHIAATRRRRAWTLACCLIGLTIAAINVEFHR